MKEIKWQLDGKTYILIKENSFEDDSVVLIWYYESGSIITDLLLREKLNYSYQFRR